MNAHQDTPEPDRRTSLRGRISRTLSGVASWSGRNPLGVSSALAPAPGVAEEAGRQGAPGHQVAAEGSRNQDQQPPSAEPYDEPSPLRELDDPPLPAPLNRKRTTEKRNQVRSIRFTKTAIDTITAAATARGVSFAGYVGNAALATALGESAVPNPEDDDIRLHVETLEAMTAELRRIGNNLNQIARAVNMGATPAHADAVLDRVHQLLTRIHAAVDELMAE